MSTLATKTPTLLADLRALIAVSRQAVAQGINSALVPLYWQICQRIRIDILKQKRVGYGDERVNALSAKLQFTPTGCIEGMK